MRAILHPSSSSSATTTTTTTAKADSAAAAAATGARSLLKRASSSQLSRSPTSETLADNNNNHTNNNNTHTFSFSSSSSFPRRIKSKASLRSLGSSYFDDYDHDATTDQLQQQNSSLDDKTLVRPSILRRLSPGLAARVKLLDGSSNKTATPPRPHPPSAVGRIPQEHLKELDSLHQDLSIKIQKRGRAWSGLYGSRGRRKASISNLFDKEKESEGRADNGDNGDLPPQLQVDVATEPLELPAGLTLEPTEPPLDPDSGSANRDIPTSIEQHAESVAMSVAEPTLPTSSHSQSGSAAVDEPTDFEKYLRRSTQDDDDDDRPPPPPPKDSPPPLSVASPSSSNSNNNNVQSYFNPMGLHRTESIYSFSRASFSNQLSQLTSISLPQPSSLEAGIAGISNAPAAVKALTGAAEQIRYWIKKAYDVLSGLDAEDDAEWAAAAGREGLDGVDKAIGRFESLVNIYVTAIEEVQLRPDIGDAAPDSLKGIVSQMELILKNWAEIKAKLKAVKEQVELAMEWEELWTNVLGDVGQEVESLSGLIFEMEEKRHMTLAGEEGAGGMESVSGGLDINELETIVEESPSIGHISSKKRVGGAPNTPGGAPTVTDTPIIQTPQDDSNYTNLMGLFARMQPLRASLDFLPMRLSMFQSRADKIFPSACEELEHRRRDLEQSYQTLEADAEALKKELEEDRWILVFRNAGQQAQRMFDSVERSIAKLQECLEMGAHLHNVAALTKRMESYEAKKQHYVPAIQRVVAIIEKGVKDRLTVNGEVLSLLSDMQSRTDALKASIKVMDSSMEEINLTRSQQLRDSISSIVTMDSPATGSAVDTPGSSPASSVVMHPVSGGTKGSTTPLGSSSRRGSSVGSSTTRNALPKTRRYSGIPPPPTTTLTSRKSSIPKASSSALSSPSAPRSVSSAISPSPAGRKPLRPPPTPVSNKPRWNGSTNTADLDVGHNFKSVSVTTPTSSSSYRKASAPSRLSRASSTTLPTLGPFSRDQSASPAPPGTLRSTSRMSSRLGMRGSPAAHTHTTSPSPSRSILLDPPPYSKLRKASASSALQGAGMGMSTIPRSRQSFAGKPSVSSVASSITAEDASGPNPITTPSKVSRPGTALGHSGSRRVSLLPLPKSKIGGGSTTIGGGRSKVDDRPPWRG